MLFIENAITYYKYRKSCLSFYSRDSMTRIPTSVDAHRLTPPCSKPFASFSLLKDDLLSVVVHTFNRSSWEVEVSQMISLCNGVQPGLYSKS